MNDSDWEANLKKNLEKANQQSMQEADARLAEELTQLQTALTSNLETLRPKVSDFTVINQYMAAVNAATSCNDDIADLQFKLKTLGVASIKAIQEIAKLIP